MKTINQLKTAFIAGISLLSVFTSCKKGEAYSNPYQPESSAGLQQTNTAMPGCGNDNLQKHFISIDYGYKLIDNYRKAAEKEGGINAIYNAGGWVLAETFPAEAVQRILSQKGCCKVRIYNGIDSDNRQHLVMVGVNEYGVDVFYCNGHGAASEDSCINIDQLGLIVEMGSPCPESCGGVYTGS